MKLFNNFIIILAQVLIISVILTFVFIFIQNRNAYLISLLIIIYLLIIEWFILYIFSLIDVIDNISPSNKEISTKEIWLLLIPFFNTFFIHFYITIKVYTSIKREYILRGIGNEVNSSLLIMGILMCITGLPFTAYLIYNIINWQTILGNLDIVFSTNLILGILNIIFWFIYWYQISKVASLLNTNISNYLKK